MESSSKFLWGCGSLVVGTVLLVFLVLVSGAQVNAGYVGVVSNWGAIDQGQQPLAPGFHVVMPLATHIQSVSVQPQNHQFKKVGAASKELQNVYVDGGVNYHVNAEAAAKLTISGGVEAIVDRVFDPAFQDFIKEIVPTYAVTDILPNRAQIRDAVKAKLAEKAAPYGLTVDDVFITNISFDADYTKAIEAKQVAAQRLEQAKIEAQTAVTTAEGQAKANSVLNASLTATLIAWLEIQKWNGTLPLVVGSSNVFVPIGNGATPGK